MSDNNPFDDLADDESGVASGSGRNPKSQKNSTTTEQTGRSTRDSTSDQAPTRAESQPEGPSLEDSSPPFSYNDAEQNQVYTQSGLWDDFEDLKFDAEMALRKEHDIRNVEQRELDTAVLAEVLDRIQASDIAERVIHKRGFDPER